MSLIGLLKAFNSSSPLVVVVIAFILLVRKDDKSIDGERTEDDLA